MNINALLFTDTRVSTSIRSTPRVRDEECESCTNVRYAYNTLKWVLDLLNESIPATEVVYYPKDLFIDST